MKPSRSTSRPTTADVAALAGVSQSAVSRAFSPGKSISPRMRRKVEAAAQELGFRPNAIARAMTTRSSRIIGLLISHETVLNVPTVVLELTMAFAACDLTTMLIPIASPDCMAPAIDKLLAYQVDGAVVAGTVAQASIDLLRATHLPFVLYNRSDERGLCTSVTCDHFGCGRLIAERIVEAGLSTIGVIEGPVGSTVAAERVAGVLSGLDGKTDMHVHRANGNFSYDGGASAMRQLLAVAPTFDVIVAVSDMMAIGAMDVVRTNPQFSNCRFVGFDGIEAGGWDGYRLTTVGQPIARMAKAAASLIASMLKDPMGAAETRTYPGLWVDRASFESPDPVAERSVGLATA